MCFLDEVIWGACGTKFVYPCLAFPFPRVGPLWFLGPFGRPRTVGPQSLVFYYPGERFAVDVHARPRGHHVEMYDGPSPFSGNENFGTILLRGTMKWGNDQHISLF